MKKELFVAVALLVLTIFVFGCTANNEGTSSENNTETGTESTETNTGTGSGSSLSDILSIKSVKYTAEYEATMEGKTQKWTQVYDLPNFATITQMPEGEGEMRMIVKDSAAYSCDNIDGDWRCFKLASAEISTNDELEEDVEEGATKPVYKGTCSRAGLTGEKYKIISGEGETNVCYTKKGILLELETPDTTMYATKVSESIDSSIFTLPAEPQDLSSIASGIPDFE